MTTDRPNRGGRPRKSEGPRVPYEELDRILVFGEVVPCEDGNGTTVVFPSYRELGDRYGVTHSVIADYAKTRNVQRRRKEALARVKVKAEQKLVEARATAIAYSKDDELRIIDGYLAGFEKAVAEGRVRFDNPADFNTMVRLKEFVQGNADSRQEIHASLSLEVLQARHRQMIRAVDVAAEERGVSSPGGLSQSAEGSEGNTDDPPALAVEAPPEEPPGGFQARSTLAEDGPEVGPACGAVAPDGGPERAPAEPGPASEPGATSGDVAPQTSASTVCASGLESVPGRAECSSTVELERRRLAGRPPEFRGVPAHAGRTESSHSDEEEHGQGEADELAAGGDAIADTVRPPPPAAEGTCE